MGHENDRGVKSCRRADGEPKLRYDPMIAVEAAEWLRHTTDEPYMAYECGCGAWHIGRRSRTSTHVTHGEDWVAELGERAAEMLARENTGRASSRKRAVAPRFRRARRQRRDTRH